MTTLASSDDEDNSDSDSSVNEQSSEQSDSQSRAPGGSFSTPLRSAISDSLDDADVPHPQATSDAAKPRFSLTPRLLWTSWLCLFVWEGLFLSGCVVFFVANLFPLPYVTLPAGVVLAFAPFLCLRLFTARRQQFPRFGVRPQGHHYRHLKRHKKSEPLLREQMCRWLSFNLGCAIAPLNIIMIALFLWLWWGPFVIDGANTIPLLCVSGLGHVSFTTANIMVRCPRANRARVLVWAQTSGNRDVATSAWVDLPSDSGSLLVAENLTAATFYRFFVEIDRADGEPDDELPALRGSFRTPPTPGSPEALSKFRFTFGSCLLKDSFKNLDALAEIQRANVSFILFLGDFIYIDQPNIELLGTGRFGYVAKYTQVLDDPMMRNSRLHIPWYMMYDDHEIQNDWSSGSGGFAEPAIHDVWWSFLGRGNPLSPSPPEADTVDGVVRPFYWFTFRHGPACFFVLDVRRHRSPNSMNANDPAKTMLGKKQLADLLTWLDEADAADCVVKFIGTPVPMSATAWSADLWSTFVFERNLILDHIEHKKIAGVLFLSGDRHTAGAIQLRPDGSLYEFSASPMDGFWSTFRSFPEIVPNETVLIEVTSRDYWGTVDVDATDAAVVRVTLAIDGKQGFRAFEKTLTFNRH